MQSSENKNAIVTSLEDQEALNAIYIISDPTRMQIMQILSVYGALCAHEILSYFDISQPTLSHHMGQLCDYNLVDSQKDGRRVFYSVSEIGIKNIIQLFEKMMECTYETTVIKDDSKKTVKEPGVKKSPMLPKPKKIIKKPDVPKENVINKSKTKKKKSAETKKAKAETKKDSKKGSGKKKGKKKKK